MPRSFITLLLLLACSCSSALAGIPPAPAAEPPPVIDDDAIVARIETEGTALIKAGKIPKLKTLRAQLPNAKIFTGEVPAPDLTALTPAELYAKRASGVLVVAVLGKVKKRTKY